MVQVALRPAEFCDVELPCNDLVEVLVARAFGGKCSLHVQASQDGQTWQSPVASARLSAESTTLRLRLPAGTRRIRAVLENGLTKATHVEIDDIVTPAVTGDDEA